MMHTMHQRSVVITLLVVLIAVVTTGCGAAKKAVYLNQQANFGAVETVALMPLDNFTSDVNAPEKVSQILTIELLSADAFQLLDTGQTRAALQAVGFEFTGPAVSLINELSADQVRQVGEALGAQALLMGTVRELGVDRSAGVPAPQVSLQFRLVDTASGETIWSSVVSRSGAGAGARLFGVGGKSVNKAIQEMVREALTTLIR